MSERVWQTSDFDFHLPEELIAQRPSAQRGESRLMYLPPHGAPQFNQFTSIAHLFSGDEVLILNDTRVVPARLHGQKTTGGRVEVFFLEIASEINLTEEAERLLAVEGVTSELLKRGVLFRAMTRGKLRVGSLVHLPLSAEAIFLDRDDQGVALMLLNLPIERITAEASPEIALWSWLEEAGQLPLPPYIQRTPDELDRERYQTVFARSPGAIAAPTAGLHFTQALLDELRARGVEVRYVTLHVGPGTFLPVKSARLEDHVMHHERYEVPLDTQESLRSGRPIIAVGTTVVRALESFMESVELDPTLWGRVTEQSTDIFISPGYQWRVVDGLITNFHLPQSTLLMLVSALAGYERVMDAYQRAVEAGLLFYSYGDASALCRPDGIWRPSGLL